MSEDQSPTLDQVIEALGARRAGRTYTMLPAKVVRYDSTRQVVDAAPVVPEAYEGEEGERVVENIPPVTEVPISYLGSGAYRETFPIAVGSYVTLVFASASLSQWIGTGVDDSDPGDDRRNHLTDAIAIPGIHVPGAAPTTVPDAWTIHAPAIKLGGADAVADAARKADLDTLKTLLLSSEFQAAVAAAFSDGGSSLHSLLVAQLATWPTASLVKIK